jgi:hypothetical protein
MDARPQPVPAGEANAGEHEIELDEKFGSGDAAPPLHGLDAGFRTLEAWGLLRGRTS